MLLFKEDGAKLVFSTVFQGVVKFPPSHWIKTTLWLYQQKKMYPGNVVVAVIADWGEDLVWNLLFAPLSFTHLSFLNCLRVGDASHIWLGHIQMGQLRRFPLNWYPTASHWRQLCISTLSHPIVQWRGLKLALSVEILHFHPMSSYPYSRRWLIAENADAKMGQRGWCCSLAFGLEALFPTSPAASLKQLLKRWPG